MNESAIQEIRKKHQEQEIFLSKLIAKANEKHKDDQVQLAKLKQNVKKSEQALNAVTSQAAEERSPELRQTEIITAKTKLELAQARLEDKYEEIKLRKKMEKQEQQTARSDLKKIQSDLERHQASQITKFMRYFKPTSKQDKSDDETEVDAYDETKSAHSDETDDLFEDKKEKRKNEILDEIKENEQSVHTLKSDKFKLLNRLESISQLKAQIQTLQTKITSDKGRLESLAKKCKQANDEYENLGLIAFIFNKVLNAIYHALGLTREWKKNQNEKNSLIREISQSEKSESVLIQKELEEEEKEPPYKVPRKLKKLEEDINILETKNNRLHKEHLKLGGILDQLDQLDSTSNQTSSSKKSATEVSSHFSPK